MINNELDRVHLMKSPSRRNLFLILHEQQKALIRPLVNLSAVPVIAIHNRYHAEAKQKIYAVCAREIDAQCHFCYLANVHDRRLSPVVSFMLPVYVYHVIDTRSGKQIMQHDELAQEKPLSGVRLLEMSALWPIRQVLAAFHAFARAGKDISSCDWTIEQTVSEQGKQMSASHQAISPLLPLLKDLTPMSELIRQRVLEFAPPIAYNEPSSIDV